MLMITMRMSSRLHLMSLYDALTDYYIRAVMPVITSRRPMKLTNS